MPYDRNEVVARITEYYTLLITHLHFDPSELKTPPSGGWPQITASRFAFLGKSDKVIDLLRRIPCLPADDDKEIYEHSVCADCAGKPGDNAVKDKIRHDFVPENVLTEDGPCDINEDTVVLGITQPISACHSQGHDGNYILLDGNTGAVIRWDIKAGWNTTYRDAREAFEQFRKDFEELNVFPDNHKTVQMLSSDKMQGMKDAIRSFGWPPAKGDGVGWKREEYFNEAKRLFDEYYYWRECELVEIEAV